MKVCSKCGEEKSLDQFHRDRRYAQGVKCWCKDCAISVSSDWHRDNPARTADHARRSGLKAFGMTVDDYDQLLAAQGGRCWICKRKPHRDRRLAVDHSHRSGEVRGLLCHNCNTTLGYMHENIEWFTRAAAYLTEPPSRQVFATPRRHVDAPPIALLSSDMETD